LADLYRRAGREAEANALLREAATSVMAGDASVHAALGLSAVRLGQTEQALESLRHAAELADQDPYLAYSYGLALDSLQSRASSLAFLSAAQQRFPGYGPILFALATMYRDLNERDMALQYVQQLLSVSPGDASALSLERELRTAE
jgi:tetratricopeptide (TPR) repeat protein